MTVVGLIALNILFSSVYAWTKLTQEEELAIVRDPSGVLLNAPGRKLNSRISNAEQELNDILQALIKNDPRSANFEWRINIYNSSDVNAWPSLSDPQKSAEAHERKRAFYKIESSKPIASLSVTTGLLAALRSQGELAFILAHEITHILEGHTATREASGPGRNWYDSQSNEVVADKGGIALMIGNFDINASLKAMIRMLALRSPESESEQNHAARMKLILRKAFESSITTHHQEGVRISLLQIEIEHLKRSDIRATKVTDQAISPKLQALTARPAPGATIGISTQNFYRQLTSDLLNVKSDPFSELNSILYERRLVEQAPVWTVPQAVWFINQIMDQIAGSQAAPNVKAQTLFLILYSNFSYHMHEYGDVERFLKNLDSLTIARIKRLLLGLKMTNSKMVPYFKKRSESTNYLFVKSKRFQQMMTELAQQNFSWNHFVSENIDSTVNNIFFSNAKLDLNSISRALLLEENNNSARELSFSGPIHRKYAEAVLNALSKVQPDALSHLRAKELAEFLSYVNRENIQKFYESSLGQEFRIGIQPVVNALNEQYRKSFLSTNEWSSIDERLNAVEIWFFRMLVQPGNIPRDEALELFRLLGSFDALADAKQLNLAQFRNWLNNRSVLAEKVFEAFLQSWASERLNQPAIFGHLVTVFSDDIRHSLDKNPNLLNLAKKLFLQKANDLREIHSFLFGNGDRDVSRRVLEIEDIFELGQLQSRLMLLEKVGLWKTLVQSAQSKKWLDESFRAHEQILSSADKKYEYTNSANRNPPEGSELLVRWTLELAKSETQLDAKLFALDRFTRVVGVNFLFSPEQKEAVSVVVKNGLSSLKGKRLFEALDRASIKRSLPENVQLELLEKLVRDLVPPGSANSRLTEVWTSIAKSFEFSGTGRSLGLELRNRLSMEYKAQPVTASAMFPLPKISDTELMRNASSQLRGWSGFTELIQGQTPNEQLQAIDYLMGRSSTVPTFVTDLDQMSSSRKASLAAERLRSELSASPEVVRSFFINSLFQGKNAPLVELANRELLIEHLFQGMPTTKKSVARELAYAVFTSEGINSSLILSAILAERPSQETTHLSEDYILKIMLESYGVPGWKLAQYLAFTGEFKEYAEVLARFQDAAPAPGYYDILEYLKSHLSHLLDLNRFKIIKLLGAGSVNLAIEYIELSTNKTKVINIPRENIVQKTTVDFMRFRKLMSHLASRSPQEMDFTFLVGLSGVIEASVKLEFDRDAVLERQRDAVKIYNNVKVGNWTIQTVHDDGKYGDAILMDKARVMTARQLLESNPKLYKDAMRAVYDFEYKLMFKRLEIGEVRLANPDLHDGQFLVDPKNRTISVIDFGQALRLSQNERELALDLVAMAEGIKSKSQTLSVLQSWIKQVGSKDSLSLSELDSVFKVTDSMDRFVRLISLMNNKNADLPLGAVHLVLAVNRLSKLGHKVGRYSSFGIGRQVIWREIIHHFVRKSNIKALANPPTRSVGASAEVRCQNMFLGQ